MIKRLDDRDTLDRALDEPGEALPVYRLDVLADPDRAHCVASTLGVHHESPQAIVVTDGKAMWSASHSGVRARAIRNAVNGAER